MQDNFISRTMNFFTNLTWKLNHFKKFICQSGSGNCWNCDLALRVMILLIVHSEGPTEIRLNSFSRLDSRWSRNSFKSRIIFFNIWFGKSFISKNNNNNNNNNKWLWKSLRKMLRLTVVRLCKLIILLIVHVESPTEV